MKLINAEILIKCDCGETVNIFADGVHDRAQVEIVKIPECRCRIRFFAHIQEVKP